MSEELNVAAPEGFDAGEFTTAEPAAESPAPETVEAESAGANVVELSTDAPQNSEWMQPDEIIKTLWFKKLSPTSAELLLEFWRTGSRLAAVESVMGVEGESARLACLLFDKGSLKFATDQMLGISERDQVLAALAKAVRSIGSVRRFGMK